MTSNGYDPTENILTPAELRDHNLDEMRRATVHLNEWNNGRIAILREGTTPDPWVQLEFEMLSLKMDVIVDALAELLHIDKETGVARYGLAFQTSLAQLLDRLMTPSQEPSP